ncbi:hypothetical protein [Pseudomonas moraviensis]
MLRKSVFLLSATCLSTVTFGADVSVDSSKNTYSVIMENLQSGEKSKITVSGPAGSEESQTKDLVERIARDAFNSDANKQPGTKETAEESLSLEPYYFHNFDGSGSSKILLPKGYAYSLPGYSNGLMGTKASIPGHSTNPLAEENTKLRELVQLQQDQIKLLQDEISSLQGKSK